MFFGTPVLQSVKKKLTSQVKCIFSVCSPLANITSMHKNTLKAKAMLTVGRLAPKY